MKMTLVLVAAAMAEPSRFKTQASAPAMTTGETDDSATPTPPHPRCVSCCSDSSIGDDTDAFLHDSQEPDSDGGTLSATRSNNDRLPVDVLIDILRAWKQQDPSNPHVAFHASQICGSWREAAKAAHSLWDSPEFRFNEMLDNPAWIEYHACFARYGSSRGFLVRLYNDVGSVPSSDRVWTHFCTNILSKARRIDLEISTPGGDPDILAGRMFALLCAIRVRFTLPDAEHANIKMFMTAPKLTHVELVNTYMEFEDLANRETNPLWSLTSFCVTRQQYSAANLFGLARVCIALREFNVTIETLYDWPSDPIVWNSLRTLRVSVETIFDGDKILFRGITIPNLITLEVRDNKYNWNFWRQFVELSCPALTRLCVHNNNVDHGKHFVDGMGKLSQVRELVFRNGSLNQDIVALLVMPEPGQTMPFPDLQSVRFENATPLRGFECSLIQFALQHRYAYLRGRSAPGPFSLTCQLKRKSNDEEENGRLASMERSVIEYNEEERKRFQPQA